jgi:hypothetical protein
MTLIASVAQRDCHTHALAQAIGVCQLGRALPSGRGRTFESLPLVLFLALLVAPVWGADIEAPANAPEHTLVELRCTTPGKGYAWQVIGEGLLPVRVKVDSGDKSQATFTGKPGRYVAMVFVLTEDGLDQGQHFVTIGPSPPEPPPGPQPPPGPGPVVPPGPPPITDGGLRVLIVYDEAAKASMTKDQLYALASPKLRDFMDANCVKVNSRPEWYIVDKGEKFEGQPIWQKAMALPRPSLPCFVVSNGKAGEVLPLKSDVDALAVIQRYVP